MKKAIPIVSLSVIYKYITGNGFFIVSGFVDGKSEEENDKKQNELGKDLKKLGLRFYELVERWRSEKTGKIEMGLSFFVPYNPKELTPEKLRDVALELGKKYNQDVIIFQYPGLKEIELIDIEDGEVLMTFSRFHPYEVGEAYSIIKHGKHTGSSFMFEGIREPSGWAHAMLMKEQGYIL